MAEEVAEPAAEEQEAAIREQVAVHDPGERRLREAEILLDRRQGDADDRDGEDDYQRGQAEDVEGDPAASVTQFGHLLPLSMAVSSPVEMRLPALIDRPSR